MTTLEARVAALENDVLVLCAAVQQIATTQTLFTAISVAQLQQITSQVKRLRDELDEGDEWKDFG